MARLSSLVGLKVASVAGMYLILGLHAGPVFSQDDLKETPTPKPTPTPSVTSPMVAASPRPLSQALKERVNLQFNGVTLEEVVKRLRERHGITINVDRRGQGDAAINQAQLVTCELTGMRLQAALDLMLPGLGLDWIVVDDALLVTTPKLAGDLLETRFYNIGDLSVEVEQLNTPTTPSGTPPAFTPGSSPFELEPSGPQASLNNVPKASNSRKTPGKSVPDPGDDLFSAPPSRTVSPANAAIATTTSRPPSNIRLVELIETSISANWKDAPPQGRPIRQLSNHPQVLVIRQPQRVHREIEALFARLRIEVKKTGGQQSDELVTIAYPTGQVQQLNEESITRLLDRALKVITMAQLTGNQSPEVQKQLLKIAEQQPNAAGRQNESIGDALIDLIEPESWKKNGGRGELRVLPTAILIKQTPEVHSQIQRTLSTMLPGMMSPGMYNPSCVPQSAGTAPNNPLPTY